MIFTFFSQLIDAPAFVVYWPEFPGNGEWGPTHSYWIIPGTLEA